VVLRRQAPPGTSVTSTSKATPSVAWVPRMRWPFCPVCRTARGAAPSRSPRTAAWPGSLPLARTR